MCNVGKHVSIFHLRFILSTPITQNDSSFYVPRVRQASHKVIQLKQAIFLEPLVSYQASISIILAKLKVWLMLPVARLVHRIDFDCQWENYSALIRRLALQLLKRKKTSFTTLKYFYTSTKFCMCFLSYIIMA